ncbi:MAG TPA: hypothetical protein VK463_09010 [Desulfomonilaceae bacterium]|nr:hypothetical protein [Desulfomonilaceae bacterium]
MKRTVLWTTIFVLSAAALCFAADTEHSAVMTDNTGIAAQVASPATTAATHVPRRFSGAMTHSTAGNITIPRINQSPLAEANSSQDGIAPQKTHFGDAAPGPQLQGTGLSAGTPKKSCSRCSKKTNTGNPEQSGKTFSAAPAEVSADNSSAAASSGTPGAEE